MEKEVTVFVHSVTQALQKTKVTKFACRNKSALAYKEGLNHIIEASKGRSWLWVAMFDVTTGNWNCNCPVSSLDVWPQCQRAYCCDFVKLRSWSCWPRGSHKNGVGHLSINHFVARPCAGRWTARPLWSWLFLATTTSAMLRWALPLSRHDLQWKLTESTSKLQRMSHDVVSTSFLPGDGRSLER